MTYSKFSKREREDLFKIQQERDDDLFKIQQEKGRGLTQNPARERRRGLSIGVNVISTHCWWFFFFFSVHEGEREKKGKDGLR